VLAPRNYLQRPHIRAVSSLIQDDFVAPFQIDAEPVRGRIVRLGAAVDQILAAHAYPPAVANLLGEACTLAALVGASLKFEGRLIVQAQGDGPVAYVIADYDATGALRGFCRFDADRLARACAETPRPGAGELLGNGVFIMTVDPDGDRERYQGVTPIEGETLALCAETNFSRSEQTPTRVRLAVGQADVGEGPRWRAGGLIIQNIAEDDARGSTAEAWLRAQAHMATVAPDELIDPSVPAETLLWRLFHEDGVRLFAPTALRAFCRCSAERIVGVLRAFGPDERAAMVEADGKIGVTCEYCSKIYAMTPEAVG